MAPFCKLTDLNEQLLDPIDEEDEAELNTYDPAEIIATNDTINQVVESCQDLVNVVATDAEAHDVAAEPGKALPIKTTKAMVTDASEILPKMCGLAKALRNSTLVKLEWESICLTAKKSPIAIRRSVKTRWNTTTGMLDDIVMMEAQIKRLVVIPGLGLEKYTLNES